MRVTDEETMAIVEMVLRLCPKGDLRTDQLDRLESREADRPSPEHSLGRQDCLLIKDQDSPGETFDLGLVGRIDAIDRGVIRTLAGNGFVPLIGWFAALHTAGA